MGEMPKTMIVIDPDALAEIKAELAALRSEIRAALTQPPGDRP